MKKPKWTLPAIGLGLILSFSAMRQANAGIRESKIVHVLPHDTMSKKVREFKKEWNKKIHQLDKSIKKDQGRLDKASTKNKAKLNDEILDMKVKRDELKKEVDDAGNKTAAQWDAFKENVSEKYDKLSTKVKDFFNNKQ